MGNELIETRGSVFKVFGIHYCCTLGIPLLVILFFSPMLGSFNVPFLDDFFFSYSIFLAGPFLSVVLTQEGIWGPIVLSLILRLGFVSIVALISRHGKYHIQFFIAIGIQIVISFFGVMLWIGAH